MTELEKLQAAQIQSLMGLIESQSKQIESLSADIKKLLAQVKQLTALEKAKKSERSSLPKAASGSSRGKEQKDNKGKKGKAPSTNNFSFPDGIPVEEIRIDLPESEKVDPVTGKPFQQLSEERYEYLMFEKVYKKVVVIRPVYGMGPKLGVARMDLPEGLLGNCKAHASLISHIMVQRFLEHLPFYRQADSFAREGFSISRQSLHGWYTELAEKLKPLYLLLREWILGRDAIHIDETFAKRQKQGKDKLQDVYFWFISACAEEYVRKSPAKSQAGENALNADQQVVFLQYFESRKEENAREVLGDYSGKVHSDCYGAYEKAADKDQFIWQICLVHCRRNFIKVAGHPIADEMIERLGKIIHEDNELMALSAKERLRRRLSRIKPQTDELLARLKEMRQDLKVESNEELCKAFDYIIKREQYADSFIKHAELCADNNRAERSIRPMKIGQRNWLFVGSEKGGESTAIMYSLLLTCKNLGINPQKWLTDVILNMPYTRKEDYASLLPMNWKPKSADQAQILPSCYEN